MKRLSFFLSFLATGLLFLSCGKDPVVPPTTQELLLGTWTVDVSASTLHEEENFDGELLVEDYSLLEEGMVECRLVFHPDGLMEMTSVYDYGEGQREQFTDRIAYTIEDNYLVWDGEERLLISHIDSQRLVLDEHGESVEDDGTYIWDMHLECSKQ